MLFVLWLYHPSFQGAAFLFDTLVIRNKKALQPMLDQVNNLGQPFGFFWVVVLRMSGPGLVRQGGEASLAGSFGVWLCGSTTQNPKPKFSPGSGN